MSEEATISDVQDETLTASDHKGETPTPQSPDETPGTATDTTQQSDEIRRELDRLKASLKRANAEAKEHREKATELAKFKEATEAEKLTENEKRDLAQQALQKQLAEAQSERDRIQSQMQELRVRQEVYNQASRINVVDPDAASKLIDWSEIDYDEKGAPTNINDLVKRLVKDKPYLIAPQQRQVANSGGATNPSRTQTVNAGTAITEDFIASLTPDAYGKLSASQREEVQKVIQKRGRR